MTRKNKSKRSNPKSKRSNPKSKSMRMRKSMRMPKSMRMRKSMRKQGKDASLVKLVVPKFLEMINTIKIYHWKTSSYATHKATDQLFADLNTKTDEFVEVMLGKSNINRDAVLNFPTAKISSFGTNAACKLHIEKYISFLLALPRNKCWNQVVNVDLLAIRDEIVALLNQFLYLLTLH